MSKIRPTLRGVMLDHWLAIAVTLPFGVAALVEPLFVSPAVAIVMWTAGLVFGTWHGRMIEWSRNR